MRAVFLALLCCATVQAGANNAHDYALKAQSIGTNTYGVFGSTKHFSIANGGNIVNTAFIVTDVGVVVIDTGPTMLYGRQLRDLIKKTTGQPIIRVYNTHHHPDHFLGNQAFSDVPIFALDGTRAAMQEQAEAFNDNLYRLLGTWMKDTVPHLATDTATPGIETIGGHRLETFAFRGHTDGDLVLYDHTSGVLFAGDLVFHRRTPTTPNADLAAWLSALDGLRTFEFKVLFPGHGALVDNRAPIGTTADYLKWLEGRINDAVSGGRSMAETLFLPIPARFRDLDTLTDEYRRSVEHVFPDVEHEYFRAVD